MRKLRLDTMSTWVILAIALVSSPTTPRAQTSQLWGQTGELWDPRGRLPDFSYAGYHGGDRPIPTVPVVANVKSFGAVGDGVTDDTQAFKNAIAQTTGGALLIPRGRYLITDILNIRNSNLVLRGEGRSPTDTVLYFPLSLTAVTGQKQPQWSWNYGLINISPPSRGRAIAAVVEPALRGDTALTVDSAAGIAAGSLVVLAMTDDAGRSLGQYLHNGQAGPGICTYQLPLTLDVPLLVSAVRGDRIEFSQPLRTDVRPGWTPTIESAPFLQEVGIEDLRIEFSATATFAGHNNEDGYNAIFFENGVANSWVRQVTIQDSDNAVIMGMLSKWLEVRDVRLEGRLGHHGFRCEHAADCLVTDFDEACDRIHAMSLDHRTNGCVFSRGRGQFTLEMDNHRDSPFENLFTDFQTNVSFKSSGSLCAGPHAGARTTFWNLPNALLPPLWGSVQINIVGKLLSWNIMTANREWYEVLSSLQPTDLHLAQLARRRQPAPTVFSQAAGGLGDRANFQERDRGRWQLAPDGGDVRYQLFVAGYPAPGGGRLGEYSAYGAGSYDDVALSALARTEDDPTVNLSADLALVLGEQDDTNYYMALFSANAAESGIYRVLAGSRTLIGAAGRATITDRNYHRVEFRRVGAVLTMLVDGAVAATVSDSNLGAGRVGVGSLDDAVWFDDIDAQAALTAQPPTVSLASGGAQQLTLDAGPTYAGLPYLIIGSLTGTTPGFALQGINVPLNVDPYTQLLAGNPNTLIAGSSGNLDGAGTATATMTLPPGLAPQHAGLVLHHAYLVFDTAGARFASNATALTLRP